MRKYLSLIVSLLFFTLLGEFSYGQGGWRSLTDYDSSRTFPTTFSIGEYGYLGLGNTGGLNSANDFWRFDPQTKTWSQIADYTGSSRWATASFVIGNKAWVGTGRDQNNSYQDFYMYDPNTNTWTNKASFPGTSRRGAFGFAVNDKGYVGCGWNGTTFLNDMYEYDTANDSWASKANLGNVGISYPFAIGYNNKGYVGGGYTGNSYLGDFYEYDPNNDSWSSKASIPKGRYGACAFIIGSFGYVGCGYNGTNYLNDFYKYDFINDTWDSINNNLHGIEMAGSFSVQGKGYIIGGDSVGVPKKYFTVFDTLSIIPILSTKTVCPGTSFNVYLNTTDTLGSGNIFTIQISDSSGDFTNAIDIGSLKDSIGGTVICSIPKNMKPGIHYKLRAISTIPYMIGKTSVDEVSIHELSKPIIANKNGLNVCTGDSVKIFVDTNLLLNWKSSLLTIEYNPLMGQSTLNNANKIYLHSGISDTNLTGSTWSHVIGNWSQDDSVGIMTKVSNNQYKITIDVLNYYQLNMSEIPKYIGLKFRNEDGTKTGYDPNGNEIYIDIQTGAILSSFNGVNAYWESSYQWLKDGQNITSANSSELIIKSTGKYSLIYHGKNCPDTSSEVTVNIGPDPKAGFEINSQITQCFGGNAFFFNDTSFVPSNQTYDWTWDYGDGFSCHCVKPSHSYLNPGTYQVTLSVITSSGCVDTVRKTLTVLPSIQPWFTTNSYSQCKGSAFIFDDTTTNNSGLTATHLWSFGDNQTDTGKMVSHQFQNSGSYEVKCYLTLSNGCMDSTYINVDVLESHIAKPSVNKTFQCLTGNLFEFKDSSSNINQLNTRIWKFGDNVIDTAQNPTHSYTKTGQYNVWLILNNSNGCMDSNFITINIDSIPTISINNLGSTSICKNETTVLKANGKSGYNYQWIKNGNNINGEISDSLIVSDSGSYQLKVGTGQCSSLSNKISILTIPFINIGSISGPTTITNGATANYSVTNINNYVFNWNITGGILQSGQGTNQVNVKWNNIGNGSISVNGNCSDTSSISVNINSGTSIPNDLSQLQIYPNPTEHFITIETNPIYQKLTIQIVDLTGKVLIESNSLLSNNQIDIGDLNKGLYFVKLKLGNEINVKPMLKN